MSPADVLEIADHPETPSFLFGSEALADWNRGHRNPHTGECVRNSGFYVVIHPSLAPGVLPSFRVLSAWRTWQRLPDAWDIDDTLPVMAHESPANESFSAALPIPHRSAARLAIG